MKLAVFLVVVCVSSVFCNDIWSTFTNTGASNAEALDAIEAGVLLARKAFAGDECVNYVFGTGGTTPEDATQNNRWSTWLCSYWNPSGANGTVGNEENDCQYPDLTIASAGEARIVINDVHSSFPTISDDEFDRVAFLLAKAVQIAGGYGNSVFNTMVSDFENVRASIVKADFMDEPCRSPTATVAWAVGVDTEVTIELGQQVNFVWSDTAAHSVNTDDDTQVFGTGGGVDFLSSGTVCSAGALDDPCDLLENTDFVYAKTFATAGTFNFYCEVHPSMSAVVNVNSGSSSMVSSSSSSFQSSEEEGSSSPAATMTSWTDVL